MFENLGKAAVGVKLYTITEFLDFSDKIFNIRLQQRFAAGNANTIKNISAFMQKGKECIVIINVLIPAFMNNDYYGGISSACTILMKLASGEISELRESEDDSAAALIGTIVVLILLFIILAALFGDGGSGKGNGGRRPVIYTGPVITSGRNYGGFGGFGGGGFGGGFGGFGGGSFGGGGAGGSW